jgi:hypothetical protein
MTSPEILYTRVAINEISFLLVTHTTYSDARFDSYRIFEVRLRCCTILDRLDIGIKSQL